MTSAMHHLGDVVLWGFIATMLMTTVLLGSQGLGFSRLSLPFLLGSAFTTRLRLAYLYGYVLYAVGGWGFAFVYASLFASLRHQSWWLGALFGFVQGIFLLTALLHVPYVHPHMTSEYDHPRSTRAIEPPGFLGLHYGRQTPLITLAGHLVFGTVLGAWMPSF